MNVWTVGADYSEWRRCCSLRIPRVVLLAVAVGVVSMSVVRGFEISRNGKAACQIVSTAADASPGATAAEELALFLGQVTGARFNVSADAASVPPGPVIIVGAEGTLLTEAECQAVEALGPDGILMRSDDDRLLLAGKTGRGTLYAVYAFLEEIVGCRWWTSSESTIPSRPILEVETLNVSYTPALRCREAFYLDAFNSPFAARLKLNGHFERIPASHGGHYRILGWCHTFFQFLPPATYFADHPEWYSEIDGERKTDRTQLCVMNEEMRRELAAQALQRLRKEPNAGMISVSQNDWGGRCQCTKCRALEEAEGSPSGPLLDCVNAVAEAIEKEFPEVLVETLAYHYTRMPPKTIRPRRNVVVRLCTIECSYVEPLAAGEQNKKFRDDIRAWSQIAPKLYIWDYVTNFRHYLLPHPNMRVLAPNIRFFVKNNAIGLFEQGDAGCAAGDFVRLRAWVLAHLMWNPEQDENALIDEFLNGYYGAAGPVLREYLDHIHDVAEASGVFLRCYMTDTSPWIGLENLNRAWKIFDRALAAVASEPVYRERVLRERLPLEHAWLQRYSALRRQSTRGGIPFLGPPDPVAASRSFVQRAHECGVKQYAEGRSFEPYAEVFGARFSEAASPPEACKKLAPGDWVDFQEADFRLYRIGSWVYMEDDRTASNGKTCRMPGNHPQWAVQIPVSADIADGTEWNVRVRVRCEANAQAEGKAFECGVYDSNAQKGLVHRDIMVNDVAGGTYREIDLGSHRLQPGTYIWVAPPNRPDGIRSVCVDRAYLVRSDVVGK